MLIDRFRASNHQRRTALERVASRGRGRRRRGDGSPVDRDTARVQPLARIRVLGRFDLSLDGMQVPPLESARAESLLAFVLLQRNTAASRQHLAFLLWPDSSEAQARTNLRHLLPTL